MNVWFSAGVWSSQHAHSSLVMDLLLLPLHVVVFVLLGLVHVFSTRRTRRWGTWLWWRQFAPIFQQSSTYEHGMSLLLSIQSKISDHDRTLNFYSYSAVLESMAGIQSINTYISFYQYTSYILQTNTTIGPARKFIPALNVLKYRQKRRLQ